MQIKILLSGDGGQGIQTIAEVISRAAFEKGLTISFIPNYGLEQRGGVSLAFIKIGDQEIVYPKFSNPDILLIMSDQSRQRVLEYISKSKKIIDIKDYNFYLQEKKINSKNYNIFFLGFLTKMLEKEKIYLAEEIFLALEKKLSSKPNWEENKKAFALGLSFNF